jgi:hypothetical protein
VLRTKLIYRDETAAERGIEDGKLNIITWLYIQYLLYTCVVVKDFLVLILKIDK